MKRKLYRFFEQRFPFLFPSLARIAGHFESPIPTLSDLVKHRERIFFQRPSVFLGIDLNLEQQKMLLRELEINYPRLQFSEYERDGARFYFRNQAFEYSDAILLALLLIRVQPTRYFEIGSGHSTRLVLDINERFLKNQCMLTLVEPCKDRIEEIIPSNDIPQLRIYQKEVQAIDVRIFEQLEANDILFVDSSHQSKAGSDVNFILFEILPRLKPGVLVHFHDIFYPFEYPYEWVVRGRFWNEAYLLRAFLQFNRAFEILLFPSYLHENCPETFQNMPLTRKNFGASFWMRRSENYFSNSSD